MILHENPVMWKSLGIGWNWWAVLHRRRLGGLGRGWPSAKKPCHKSGPMNLEWGLSSLWRNLKKITTKFNLELHLSPSSLLLYLKLSSFIFICNLSIAVQYNGWVSGWKVFNWFAEKDLRLEINPQSVSDALLFKSFLVTIPRASCKRLLLLLTQFQLDWPSFLPAEKPLLNSPRKQLTTGKTGKKQLTNVSFALNLCTFLHVRTM